MMKLIITNEGDMEYGIDRLAELAKMTGRTTAILSFPTEKMKKVFLKNTAQEFARRGISRPINLDVVFLIDSNME